MPFRHSGESLRKKKFRTFFEMFIQQSQGTFFRTFFLFFRTFCQKSTLFAKRVLFWQKVRNFVWLRKFRSSSSEFGGNFGKGFRFPARRKNKNPGFLKNSCMPYAFFARHLLGRRHFCWNGIFVKVLSSNRAFFLEKNHSFKQKYGSGTIQHRRLACCQSI